MSKTTTKKDLYFISAAVGVLFVIVYVATGLGLVSTASYCTKCGRLKIEKEIVLLRLWGVVEGPFSLHRYRTDIHPTKLSAFLDAHFGQLHTHRWKWISETGRGLMWTLHVSSSSSPWFIGDGFDTMNLIIGTLLSDSDKATLYKAALDLDDPAARALEEIIREAVGRSPDFDERVKQILRKYGFLDSGESASGR